MSPAAPPRAHPSHGPEAQDRAPTGRSSPLRRAGSQQPSRPVHGRSSAPFDRSRRPGMRSSVHSASLTIGQGGVGACVPALIVLTAWRDCMRSWETREWAPEHDTERVRGSEAGWGERRAVWDDARVRWDGWETRRRPDLGGEARRQEPQPQLEDGPSGQWRPVSVQYQRPLVRCLPSPNSSLFCMRFLARPSGLLTFYPRDRRTGMYRIDMKSRLGVGSR